MGLPTSRGSGCLQQPNVDAFLAWYGDYSAAMLMGLQNQYVFLRRLTQMQ